jgi:hypothetical protein
MDSREMRYFIEIDLLPERLHDLCKISCPGNIQIGTLSGEGEGVTGVGIDLF